MAERRGLMAEDGKRHIFLTLLRRQPACHPLTLNAARAAMLASWASLAESGAICTGRSSPTRIGPITVAPPSTSSSLVEIEAEWKVGMISTFAGPERRQNG